MSQEAATTDPFVEYSLLGDTVEDGIFAWISFGIDLSANQSVTPAASYYASGGVENPSSGVGIPNGTLPDASS